MKIPVRSYHSKLLLLGEYTILEGGSAIAFPLDNYFGKWTKGALPPDAIPYIEYLKSLKYLDKDLIDQFLEGGYYFKSNIPVGYGLGSSGAITAATYDIFKKNEPKNVDELRDRLSEMEAFFHGKSSGLDPLCSYLNKCIIQENFRLIVDEVLHLPKGLFLVDSSLSRSTSKMVSIFKNKMKHSDFQQIIIKLKLLSDEAIRCLRVGDHRMFRKQFIQISHIQYNWFSEMLVPGVEALWLRGLESDEYFLKLSGAGGGGYYLGLGNIEDIEGIIQIS